MAGLGAWLVRRTAAARAKQRKAEVILQGCGVPIVELEKQWKAQKAHQTKLLPGRLLVHTYGDHH